MDLKIGRAEFTAPTLTQHPPSAEFKMRAALERIREICSREFGDVEINKEVSAIINAALE